ncbi:MAG: dTDP-4-dehydrorhamnose 3,5-epimerase family protein [Elusimicrobiota bacterium]
MINDVKLVPLEIYMDDRGYLIEIIRSVDPHFNKFGQVYLVGDMTRGTVRAFHKHDVLWDFFFISHGSAKFGLYDDRPDSSTYKERAVLVSGERKPSVLVVPPGVFHGWMALEDDTQMISIASEVYNRSNPDEVRVPPDSFGFQWEIEGR